MSEQKAQEPKVAREVAEQQFSNWCEAMGMSQKLDPSMLDSEDKALYTVNREVLIRAMMTGTVVLSDDSELIFTPQAGKNREPFTIPEPSLGDLKEGDKATGQAHRVQRIMGSVTGKGSAHFAEFKSRDFIILESIVLLFLLK